MRATIRPQDDGSRRRRGLAAAIAAVLFLAAGCQRADPLSPPNQPPVALASASPTVGAPPLAVSFTGTGNDPDGTIASYAWTFGDGGSSSKQNPSHTYQTAGSYTATLTVTDDRGATGSANVAITVGSNQPPVAQAGATPTSGDAPLTVAFTGTGSDPDGTIASYAWTFGDGGASTEQNPSHTYLSGGNFVATLTVTDDQGATGTASVAISVVSSNPAPVADAGPDQTNLDPGGSVTLNGTASYDPDGGDLTYRWVQTGGPAVTLSRADTATPSFTSLPSTTATYTFQLTVTDDGVPPSSGQDSVNVSTRVTYVNTTKALMDDRGKQPNGTELGCTGCHYPGGKSPSLTTYIEVYNNRSKVKSKIAPGASMRKYLLTGEPEIITSWIDNGAPEQN